MQLLELSRVGISCTWRLPPSTTSSRFTVHLLLRGEQLAVSTVRAFPSGVVCFKLPHGPRGVGSPGLPGPAPGIPGLGLCHPPPLTNRAQGPAGSKMCSGSPSKCVGPLSCTTSSRKPACSPLRSSPMPPQCFHNKAITAPLTCVTLISTPHSSSLLGRSFLSTTTFLIIFLF